MGNILLHSLFVIFIFVKGCQSQEQARGPRISAVIGLTYNCDVGLRGRFPRIPANRKFTIQSFFSKKYLDTNQNGSVFLSDTADRPHQWALVQKDDLYYIRSNFGTFLRSKSDNTVDLVSDQVNLWTVSYSNQMYSIKSAQGFLKSVNSLWLQVSANSIVQWIINQIEEEGDYVTFSIITNSKTYIVSGYPANTKLYTKAHPDKRLDFTDKLNVTQQWFIQPVGNELFTIRSHHSTYLRLNQAKNSLYLADTPDKQGVFSGQWQVKDGVKSYTFKQFTISRKIEYAPF